MSIMMECYMMGYKFQMPLSLISKIDLSLKPMKICRCDLYFEIDIFHQKLEREYHDLLSMNLVF